MLHLKRVLLRNSLGHTLIELCCVLALIGCIGLVSTRFLVIYNSYRVRVELNRLHAALLYVRRKALLEGKAQRIRFDESTQSYQVEVVHTLSQKVRFGIVQGIKGPPGDPRKPLEKAITWRGATLEVLPDGTVSSGSVYLTDESRSCLYALTSDASAITGVRRYCYRSSWELIH